MSDPEPVPDPEPLTVDRHRPSRKDRLPDVEEINSTLRPDPREPTRARERASDDPPERPGRSGSGFRAGFLGVCAAALIAVALYVFAASLSEAVPRAAGVLGDYVTLIDGLRASLEAQAERLLAAMSPEA